MAKFDAVAGRRRGAVGGESYSVVKGQCIVKAKAVQVTNPRTKSQVLQRALFSDAVSFFKHAQQALFKFAFEDKKSTESDYNAFMRHNARKGIMVTKAMMADAYAPYIGKWMLTQGSLPTLGFEFKTSTGYSQSPRLKISKEGVTISTIGELSAALINYYGLEAGDIVTLVGIVSSATELTTDDVEGGMPGYLYADDPSSVKWTIKQFVIDSSDTSSVLVAGFDESEGKGSSIKWGVFPEGVICGACAIVSRKKSSGLMVSDAYVSTNEAGIEALNVAESDEYKNACYNVWSSSEEAVLQGSLVSAWKYVTGLKGAGVSISGAASIEQSNVGYALAEDYSNAGTYYAVLVGSNLGNLLGESITCDNGLVTTSVVKRGTTTDHTIVYFFSFTVPSSVTSILTFSAGGKTLCKCSHDA